MLGQPVSMLIPRVVGFKLSGAMPEGATATDLVLTITEMLRQHGVVGKFVEFYGPGVSAVPLANRATIGNMSPEYGSTIAVFPIDGKTTDYLRLTGRSEPQIALVEAYAKEQGLWHDDDREPRYSEYLELDLGTRGAEHRRAQAAAGPGDRWPTPSRASARRCADYVGDADDRTATTRRWPRPSPPPTRRQPRQRQRVAASRTSTASTCRRHRPADASRSRSRWTTARVRARPRRGGHRRDHLLHQHLQPERDDRRRAGGQEGGRARADPQALGEDHAGPGVEGGQRLLRPRPA